MAFTSNSGGPMADINVTPLVDVMLVLLIIFMVTAPILSYPIDVNLPQRTLNPPQNPKTPQPQVNVRGDKTAKYKLVQEIVQIAQSQGMRKVGFVAIKDRSGQQ